MAKFGGISICGIYLNEIYTIDHEDIHVVNKYGYALIGNPDFPDGTSTYQEYFIIHDDLLDSI